MVAKGLCKRCVGATVLTPTSLDLLRNCESILPPNEAVAEIGACFAFTI